MPILNYTTKINAIKTISEIQQVLVRHGAKKIITDYDNDGLPIGVTFYIELQGQTIFFALPANWEGVLTALKKDKKVSKLLHTKEHALRVSWRIVKDWVEAQMAIVEAQMASVTEVFLPYAITKEGTTLYNYISNNGAMLLNSSR